MVLLCGQSEDVHDGFTNRRPLGRPVQHPLDRGVVAEPARSGSDLRA